MPTNAATTSRPSSIQGLWKLIATLRGDERGGVWGSGRFPTLSGRRGHAGEAWFPPRTRAEGERWSRRRLLHADAEKALSGGERGPDDDEREPDEHRGRDRLI